MDFSTTYQLPVPIWDANIIFLLQISEADLQEFIDKNKERLTKDDIELLWKDFRDENTAGSTMRFDEGTYGILLKDAYKAKDWAHEIAHVTNWILLDRGVIHDSSAEPWCYLTGWLTQRYLDEIQPCVKKLKKK